VLLLIPQFHPAARARKAGPAAAASTRWNFAPGRATYGQQFAAVQFGGNVNTTSAIGANSGLASAGTGKGSEVALESAAQDGANGAQFRAALDRHIVAIGPPPAAAQGDGNSLGQKINGRVGELASEFRQDQQYVSRMLEQATRTGDSMMLMKAMMALNDYQLRVQAMSKTVAKTGQAFESLTKLQ
jgi:hypothetical protein